MFFFFFFSSDSLKKNPEKSPFFNNKKNGILLIFQYKESAIRPELSSPAHYRIQGGTLSVTHKFRTKSNGNPILKQPPRFSLSGSHLVLSTIRKGGGGGSWLAKWECGRESGSSKTCKTGHLIRLGTSLGHIFLWSVAVCLPSSHTLARWQHLLMMSAMDTHTYNG